MPSSPLRLSLVESSGTSRSRLLSGLDSELPVPLPEWIKTHVQAQEWQGQRLTIERLSRASEELEGQLSRLERLELIHWLWNENEVAMEVDPALIFLVLARDLRELGIGGDLAIGGF